MLGAIINHQLKVGRNEGGPGVGTRWYRGGGIVLYELVSSSINLISKVNRGPSSPKKIAQTDCTETVVLILLPQTVMLGGRRFSYLVS